MVQVAFARIATVRVAGSYCTGRITRRAVRCDRKNRCSGSEIHRLENTSADDWRVPSPFLPIAGGCDNRIVFVNRGARVTPLSPSVGIPARSVYPGRTNSFSPPIETLLPLKESEVTCFSPSMKEAVSIPSSSQEMVSCCAVFSMIVTCAPAVTISPDNTTIMKRLKKVI